MDACRLARWHLSHQQLQDVFSLFSLHQQAFRLGLLIALVCLIDLLALVLPLLPSTCPAHSHLMDPRRLLLTGTVTYRYVFTCLDPDNWCSENTTSHYRLAHQKPFFEFSLQATLQNLDPHSLALLNLSLLLQ
jgi:hypothetical protein